MRRPPQAKDDTYVCKINQDSQILCFFLYICYHLLMLFMISHKKIHKMD